MTYIFDPANDAANDSHIQRSRTVPIPQTITSVFGYPNKLVIYKIAASRFWQARCFVNGQTHKRTTKTTSLQQAQRFARWFYESLLAKHHTNSAQTIDNQKLDTITSKLLTFGAYAAQVYANEQARVERGELGKGSLRVFRNRLDAHVLPRFGTLLPQEITYELVEDFSHFLSKNHSTTTVSHYLIVVRKILEHARRIGDIEKLPEFPKIKIKSASRGAFTPTEYWRIMRKARALRGKTHPKSSKFLRKTNKQRYKDNTMLPDMAWAIGFMVNAFLRPGDLTKMQHKHVEVIRGSNNYLRLTLPETKLHTSPIVTLRPAVRIYEQICKHQSKSKKIKSTDYLFLPAIKDRKYALGVLSVWFNWILDETGLKLNVNGASRSLYSLRHSSITFRLLYGQGIDLLTLARNARTGIEVINNHYASTVTGEQNIAMLQSKRTRKN